MLLSERDKYENLHKYVPKSEASHVAFNLFKIKRLVNDFKSTSKSAKCC